MLKIGQTVWRFDTNRRVYKRDTKGYAQGGPIWREHWEPLIVFGETSRSYLVGNEGNPIKLAKSSRPSEQWAFVESDIDRAAFMQERHRISACVSNLRDYETLRAVADLVKYVAL